MKRQDNFFNDTEQKKYNSGFTLIEILISVLILGIIFVLGFVIFGGVSASWNRGRHRLADTNL